MWRLARPRGDQPIVVRDYRKIRPQFRLIQSILRIGIPSGIENGMFQFGKLAIQSTISTLGVTAEMAAQAMANTFENLNGVAGGWYGYRAGVEQWSGIVWETGRKKKRLSIT